MRRSFIRYVARQAFGSKRLNRPHGRNGFDSLFSAFNSAKQSSGGYLDQNLWEDAYTQVIESQVDKAGNAGQETLLGDEYFAGEAKRHCRLVSKDYNPEAFIADMQSSLGDTYYNAINIIIDECAEELIEAWDYSFGGDGIGDKLFGVFQGGDRVYGSFSNALSVYQSRAAAKYGPNWNTTAAAKARSSATAARFLAKNPRGTARYPGT
jgi:hypothetical protein